MHCHIRQIGTPRRAAWLPEARIRSGYHKRDKFLRWSRTSAGCFRRDALWSDSRLSWADIYRRGSVVPDFCHRRRNVGHFHWAWPAYGARSRWHVLSLSSANRKRYREIARSYSTVAGPAGSDQDLHPFLHQKNSASASSERSDCTRPCDDAAAFFCFPCSRDASGVHHSDGALCVHCQYRELADRNYSGLTCLPDIVLFRLCAYSSFCSGW